MGKYTYLLIDIAAIFFPFILSFDKKVAFYKRWKQVAVAIILTAIPFLIWDYFKTKAGVWSFNEEKVLGIYLFNLPIEEVLFFIIVPYNVLFIYECLAAYFGDIFRKSGFILYIGMGILSLYLCVFHSDKTYTWVVSASILIYSGIFYLLDRWGSIGMLLFTFLVHLLPFYLMNGMLTSTPVVIYNESEFLGFRFLTVPNEDILYSYVMLLSYLGWYKWSEKWFTRAL